MPSRKTSAIVAQVFLWTTCAQAQYTSSGSTGLDGPLEILSPGEFDFYELVRSTATREPGTATFHFTSIHIAAGVTLRIPSRRFRGPVVWLSQGPAQIDGTIDLSGQDGTGGTATKPSMPGAGGYEGGTRGASGYGPGGGNAGGRFTGNRYLVPLVGGSGGAGAVDCGGGAGGGALLIASSDSITVNGAILANGGNAAQECGASGGSGGAIRLVAQSISGSGVISARGGRPDGGDGRLRLEALATNFTGSLSRSPVSFGRPFGLFLPPTPQPRLEVVSVDGIPVKRLSGDTHPAWVADMNGRSNRAAPLRFQIEARHIPPGSVIDLDFFSADEPVRTVVSSPLAGDLERSTALVAIDGLIGDTFGFFNARWRHTQP